MVSFFSFVALVLASFVYVSATPVSRSPSGELKARAGPSGTLIAPAGGTTVFNPVMANGGTGQLQVSYKRVNETYQGFPISTIGIDLVLHDPAGNYADTVVATGLEASPPYAPYINAYFTPPSQFSGGYPLQLVVTEHQLYEELDNVQVLEFQSAAPTIYLAAYPLDA